jgi:transposase
VSDAYDQLPTDPNALRALLLAERERHAGELAAARGEVERLVAIIKELQRHRFGRRAERLDADQLALALEDWNRCSLLRKPRRKRRTGRSR